MCDASNFGIGAALLQSYNGTNKMNLISANSRLFTQAELRLSTLMRECTAIIYTLTEYLRCIINGNDTRYTGWSADVKLFPLAYNSQITTTLGMSPYEMVFNQKPRKPIMFTANSHKNAQSYCQPNNDSICYNLPLHTHDEDHFHHPQILKLASGTHTEWILNRDKKHNEIYQKVTKKLLQRQNINEQINFTLYTSLRFKNWNICFNTQF